MNTRDVVATGFSFLKAIIILHVVCGILWYIGFLLFDAFWEDGSWEPSTESWIFGLLFWIPAVIILICGYIGLWTKLLTDSIAVGIYKANNVGDNVDIEQKLPWSDEKNEEQKSKTPPQIVKTQDQLSDDGEWKWDGGEWVPV